MPMITAIVGGLARFNGQSCMVIGHQKGRDTKEKSIEISACRVPKAIARPAADALGGEIRLADFYFHRYSRARIPESMPRSAASRRPSGGILR
jgi:hypothetical protein